jgi:TolB-like protein
MAKDYYEKGKYNYAIAYCLLSLKNNPDYQIFEEGNVLLEDSYKKIIEINLNEIKKLKNNKPKFYWDSIYNYYYASIQFNDQITGYNLNLRESLKSMLQKNEDIFYNEIDIAKNNAAEQHYNEGIRLAKLPDVDNQKNAAKQFSDVLKYISDYKDAQELYEKCKSKAIKRIAIIPFEDKSNKRGQYGGISDKVVDNIIATLLNDSKSSEFIELITREQIDKVISEQSMTSTDLFDQAKVVKLGKLLGVHEIIVGKITQIIYSPEKTSQQTIREKENVVIGQRITGYKDGQPITKDVWGDVFASVTKYKKNSYAQIKGSFTIIEVESGKIKKTDACSGMDDFNYEYASFNSGDERALQYTTKELCSKSEEYAPVEDQLVANAVDNLSKKLYFIISEYTK